MGFRRLLATTFSLCATCAIACAPHASAPPESPQPPKTERVPEQIVSSTTAGSARELYARGDRAVLAGRFEEARNALETLHAAWRAGSTDAKEELEPNALYDLALAYEGLGKRKEARDTYLEIEKRFSDRPVMRGARARLFSVLAYVEDWDGLLAASERALTVKDIAPGDRMAGLAARALAKVEKGDEASASRDVQEGLDVMESLHVGEGGKLPAPAAMLKLAQAEVGRVKSERIALTKEGASVTDAKELASFMPRMEARCQGLMDAQRKYADAMRAQDPFFLAFGAYRVGEMYRALHRDLMKIPPTHKAKTDEQRNIFFAMMHVRYRVLLEKANDMMTRTLAMADASQASAAIAASAAGDGQPVRDPDFKQWTERAAVVKAEIEAAIAEERQYLGKLGYEEATVERALEMLKEKQMAREAKRTK